MPRHERSLTMQSETSLSSATFKMYAGQDKWRVTTQDKSNTYLQLEFGGSSVLASSSGGLPLCDIHFAGMMVSDYQISLNTPSPRYTRLTLSFPATFQTSYRIRLTDIFGQQHRYYWSPLNKRTFCLYEKGFSQPIAQFQSKPFQSKIGSISFTLPQDPQDELIFLTSLAFILNASR
ncbi:hypothetical protein DSO57_1008119 [Entomophthora muscae]|uniref:Uncharacterized protein n=2 Tax=Entomophthora muscae TaxID=34485 RepID=A0ACC2TUU8_9FUNG|nr:hypothetical protein DSO57_1001758 [Entomophthora muscae]KAJ9078290.1 hypothetical protein DSO57_1008119 [Entomophthora muscae]